MSRRGHGKSDISERCNMSRNRVANAATAGCGDLGIVCLYEEERSVNGYATKRKDRVGYNMLGFMSTKVNRGRN